MNSEAFENAVKNSKLLVSKPSNEVLLQLYCLYKQATEGDVFGERPGGFDFKGAAKYDAWASQKGKAKEIASDEYIKLIEKLMSEQ
jgi:acyl-CoA-binding protein